MDNSDLFDIYMKFLFAGTPGAMHFKLQCMGSPG